MDAMPGRRLLLTIQQIVDRTGLSRPTIARWLASGKIEGLHLAGRHLVPADQLEQILVERAERHGGRGKKF